MLYGRLVRAFPGHIVLAQVALSRLLTTDRPGAAATAGAIGGRPKHGVADFVILTAEFVAVAVLELDGRANARDGQRERDRRRDAALCAAGIKVVRLPVDDIPGESALKALVAALPLNAAAGPMMRRAS
jgi:hypothetical protein